MYIYNEYINNTYIIISDMFNILQSHHKLIN